MNEKLTTIRDALIKLHEESDEGSKKSLEEWFPSIFNDGPYLKACKLLGETPVPPLEDRSNPDRVSCDGYYRLTICIRAKNMVDGKIWQPVYDGSESHYWPYFKQDESGFGFSGTHYAGWTTVTSVGSRLEYRTRELAEQGAEEFKQYYNDFFSHPSNHERN